MHQTCYFGCDHDLLVAQAAQRDRQLVLVQRNRRQRRASELQITCDLSRYDHTANLLTNFGEVLFYPAGVAQKLADDSIVPSRNLQLDDDEVLLRVDRQDVEAATFDLDQAKTKFDIMGIVQYAEPDEWMPTIGSSTTAGSPNRYTLTDQNEKGAILWVANKSIKPANLDGYFIYKHDTRQNNPPPGATSAANGTGTYASGDNADIYTLGARVSGLLQDHWQYSAEGAYQFGRKQDPRLTHSDAGAAAAANYHDMHAFGVNSRLGYLFRDKMANEVYLAYEFLSGDNPGTGDDEMFDVLWGRWPRWSELYAPYSYIPESRTAQMANIWRLGPGWSVNPVKRMNFSVIYNVMFAQQDVPTRANVPTAFSNTGNFRGHYLQAILKYQFSRHLSAHLWSEFVFPGNYYVSDQTMTFLRGEVWLTF